MSGARRTLAVYRRALRLYPKQFRDEYGNDLVLLLADQLDDEPTWRVVARSAVDLALTVPARHLEAHMDRAPAPVVPMLFAGLALGSLVVGRFVGHPYAFLACSAVGIVAACLGMVAALRTRALTAPVPASAHWWKVFGGGAGLLATLVVVTTATGELPDNGWLVAMITLLTSVILMAAGVALGIAHFFGRSGRHATA